MIPSRLLLAAFCLSLVLPVAPSRADDRAPLNMLGNQSQNAGLQAVPAPGPVTIDGDLKDWDLSGRIWSFADIALRDEYSVKTAAMWDKDYLYLALEWRDPTPLLNQINPEFNPNDAWKSDAVQLRVKTDQIVWVTAWNYAGNGSANLTVDRWKDPNDSRKGTDGDRYFGKPGSSDLGGGVQMAFTKGTGGYAQEIRIPWKALYRQAPPIQAGNKIRIGFEYIWGDATGRVPAHRYVDNMQPGTTDREFFWTAQNAWGDVELAASGNLPLRQYRAAGASLSGPVAIHLAIPRNAIRFTAVIEDRDGRRVRNLVADSNPADFAAAQSDSAYDVALAWDGRDDAGHPVAAGSYRTRGLWHRGLDAVYDTTYYNPGTPPWQTADGSGSWSSDHYPPLNVTAAGDGMIVGSIFAEGGSGLIGLGADGRKTWGEVRGSLATAADARYVYSIMSGWYGSGNLCRYDRSTGAYAPFVLEGKARPFELPLADFIPNAPPRTVFKSVQDIQGSFVTAMAVSGSRLVMALQDGRIAVVDASSAKLWNVFSAPKPTALAFAADGTLYGVLDGALQKIDPEAGTAVRIPTPEVALARTIAVDGKGDIAVMDVGPDQQVKIYSPEGKFLSTAGKKGGRPIRGKFDPQAMSHVSSIAFDAGGNLWVAENWNFPRRVSVWGSDGRLVRDYVGNTAYEGCGCYLAADPALAYVGPIELRLDRAAHTSQVARILWKADESRPDEPKSFDLDPGSAVGGQRFQSSASGRTREYLFKQQYNIYTEPAVLFMENEGAWRPVAAVGLVGQISGAISSPKGDKVVQDPQGDFAGLSAWDGFFWNDANGDGRVQRSECVIVPAAKTADGSRPKPPIPMGACWNNTMDPRDLSWLTTGIFRVKPLRFAPDGAPVYGPAGVEQVVDVTRLGVKEPRWLNPVVTADRHVLVGIQTLYAWGAPPAFCGIDLEKGAVRWTYPNPYPGVHASHEAPMPKPGLLIGPLKVIGTARVNDEVGEVMALRGNAGQDFFFTTDGLNIGALGRDTRYPSDNLPSDEASFRGQSLSHFSEGSEPFGGWFGRQDDGKIRMTMAVAKQAGLIAEVRGLDLIHRFQGPEVALTEADLEKAAAAPVAEKAAAAPSYKITKVFQPLALQGGDDAWKAIPSLTVAKEGSPERATVRMAYDDQALYVRFVVVDASPWKNGGKDFTRLFKSGDAVDLQIGPAKPERTEPGLGDRRLLFSQVDGQPVAVVMSPVDPAAAKGTEKTYVSPVGPKRFDHVEQLRDVRLAVAAAGDGYVVTAAIPFGDLGFAPSRGMPARGDVGFISSDGAGRINVARTYWANADTGLVSDEPQEAWFFPGHWGDFIFE